MAPSKSLPHALPLLFLAGSLSAVYFATLAPGLTWANHGSDGGDLIAAAATGGVAHPTGYPLYLLLARLFQFLPFGSLAFRTNLMSAVAAVIAAGLVYETVASHAQAHAWLGGIAAGFAFGLAPLVWSQAVITEVYALQALLTALILFLYTKSIPASEVTQKRLDRRGGLVVGLAMGNHITTLLLVPAALALGSIRPDLAENTDNSSGRPWKFDGRSLLRQLVMFIAGLAIYLTLPLRALSHPPVDWGNVVTPSRLWWLVSGQLYQGYYLEFSLAQLGKGIQAAAALLLSEFGLAGLLLGIIGLVVYGSRNRLYIFTGWIAAASLAFTLIYVPSDSDVYLIPLLLAFAIWIGRGTEGLVRATSSQRPLLGLGLGLLVIAYFTGRSVVTWNKIDASHDQRAETFGRQVLAEAPEDAIVFAKGDDAVFTLWYFHFALRERPDIVVVAEDLLHFDWYQDTLRTTYPLLVVPGPFPWAETLKIANPKRSACYAEYTNRAEINCAPASMSPS